MPMALKFTQYGDTSPGWRDSAQRYFRQGFRTMRIRYFEETDTLYIEFKPAEVAETRDLDENTVLDLDSRGNICAITVEHARDRTAAPSFTFERVAA